MAKTKRDFDQTITSLKGADRVRKRPAVIFGSDGIEGCEHSFFEILSNAIDEAREGYGKKIDITVYNDHSMSVEDYGRGVPMDWNEKEQRYNWDLVYCELYAGGKYNDIVDAGGYEYAIGLNGLGAASTQYASEYMTVKSYKNGVCYSMEFQRGEPVGELKKESCTKSRSGTYVRWLPDLEVFTDIAIGREYFDTVLMKQAVVNAGLTLNLRFQRADGGFDEASYVYPDGVVEYITQRVGDKALVPIHRYTGEREGRDREDQKDYKLKMEMAFTFVSEGSFVEYYHNSSFLEHGGSPDKATRSAFTAAIDDWLRNNGKYNKGESKIVYSDVEDSLVFVSNSFSTLTSYSNQTKKAITNVFIAKAMTEFFRHCLEVCFAENPQDAEKICMQILINKRSRESAENMRQNTKKKLTSSLDISNTVEKFVNCRSKDPELRELYIVEGDSALTSVKLARNAEFQAIIPVRGKTFNCLKSTYERIFKNEVITDLLKVIGCGVEIKTKSAKNMATFDMKLLKWSKIIICTDADVDGFHIRTLILTMFYSLLPSLIREGRVFIAETPLYEITFKDQTYFAYDEKEKQAILSKLGTARYTIQRSKGLGENTADMMSMTTMNPQSRRLICVRPEDEKLTAEMFDMLLGDNLAERKNFIARNGAKYLEMADIY